MSDKNIKQPPIPNAKRSPLSMILMVLFGVLLFLYGTHINKKINALAEIKNTCELNQVTLNKEVAGLKNIIAKLSTKQGTQQITMHSANARKKWSAWIALYKKIKTSANFDNELNVFNELFSYDADILHAVSAILPNRAENKFFTNMLPTSMQKYLKSIINVRSQEVQDDIFLEISGYVLASIVGIAQ